MIIEPLAGNVLKYHNTYIDALQINIERELLRTSRCLAMLNSIHLWDVAYVFAPAELILVLMRVVKPRTQTLCLPCDSAFHHRRVCFRTRIMNTLLWQEHELETSAKLIAVTFHQRARRQFTVTILSFTCRIKLYQKGIRYSQQQKNGFWGCMPL
jgi:hypothetical protein